MILEDFIKPEDIEIKGDTYRISCIPPTEAQTIFPKIIDLIKNNGELGEIMLPAELMCQIMKYSAKRFNDGWTIFDSSKKINEYLDFATLLELQIRLIRKNFDFLEDGGLLKILDSGRPPADSSQRQ